MNRLDTAVHALREQLREIEGERRALDKAEKRIERALVALNADRVNGTRKKRVVIHRADRDSANAAFAMATLRAFPTDGSPLATHEVYPLVPDYSPTGVRNGLSAQHAAGRIERVSRGVYRITEAGLAKLGEAS